MMNFFAILQAGITRFLFGSFVKFAQLERGRPANLTAGGSRAQI
jgi:hypothetical protein